MKVIVKPGIDLSKIISDINSARLQVGWGEKQRYDDGTPVAVVAATQEFGSPAKNIPPRSFMRTSSIEKEGEWKALIGQGMKTVMNGANSTANVFEMVGLKVAGDVREKIATITSPALAPSTIKARIRGRKVGNAGTATKPLVDTGYMLNSLTSEVTSK